MNNDVKPFGPQENSDQPVLTVTLLLSTQRSLDALSDMVNAFLIDSSSKGPDGEDCASLDSRATLGYFEKSSLSLLKHRRDNLASFVLDFQYFVDAYSRVLETFIRKKLFE